MRPVAESGGTRCPFDLCDGDGFVVDDETREATP